MPNCPKDLQVSDIHHSKVHLDCLETMCGFSDIPLMIQLTLLHYLVEACEATKSLLESNYLYWLQFTDGACRLIMLLTAHVDDLQVVVGLATRSWSHGGLEARLGALKRQRLPYTQARPEQTRISKDCVSLRQDKFCGKLQIATIGTYRVDEPESALDSGETTAFRSLTCSAFWSAQTNAQ